MTRLVVDAVLLALVAASVVGVSRANRGSHVKSFSGRSLLARDRWVGTAAAGVVVAGLVFGTDRYGFGTRLVNALVFSAALGGERRWCGPPQPGRRPAVSGASRPARPGDLGDADRAGLVELAAAARRSHDWAPLADRLVRLRARGVPVAALSAVVGVGAARLRVVCRDHGPDQAAVGDLLAGVGGHRDRGESGARGVGDPAARAHVRAEADGIAMMAGWTRLWHGPSLPGWWATQRVDSRTAARVRRDTRADRVRALVAGGATVAAAAAQVGMNQTSAYRYLQARPRQD